MDIEKFTDRARGFLQAAQTIAIREYHQRVTPEHLLKALLDDEQGAAAGLIRAAGGDPGRAQAGGRCRARRASPRSRAAAPASRSSRRTSCACWTPRSSRRSRPATSSSRRTGCCVALAAARRRRPGRRCATPARRPQQLEKAVADLRKGRTVNSQNAEEQLRRAEEVCARHHRSGARRQARPGDRPRRGDPPRDPGAGAPHQEQPGADRRARRRQDRDRRGPGAAHRQGRRAGGAEGQDA